MLDITTEHLQGRLVDEILELRLTINQIQDEKLAQALCDEFIQITDQHKAPHVIVDFGSIKYISSVAFRPLLLLRRKIQELNGRLILCNLSKAIGDIFYTTKMVDPAGTTASLFEMATNVAEAYQFLNTSKEMPKG